MKNKVFIWLAHPRTDSLCGSIADAYQQSAVKSGADVRRMNLNDMQFNMQRFVGYGKDSSELESSLKHWQENVMWANHFVVIFPYWWGGMPAKAKAVFDCALLPGFGFQYRGDKLRWDKLLVGRTADVIITSDTPPILDTFIYGRSGRKVIKNQILGFCGIVVKNVVQFGSVKSAKEQKVNQWLKKVVQMGTKAAQM